MALELLEGRTLGEEISWYWPETSTGAGERRAQTDELPDRAGARSPRSGRRSGPASAFPVAGGGHLAEAFSIVAQICLALDHVHRHGLVHRDVKPANVFLRRRRPHDAARLRPRLFGGSPRGRTSVGVGTMEYAAPEQICGGPVDRRADIYSLGCCSTSS